MADIVDPNTIIFTPGTTTWTGFPVTITPGYTWHGATVVPIVVPDPPIQIEIDFEDLPKEKKAVSNGCACIKCGEFYPYAEPLEPAKFRCYGCRIVM